MNYIEWHLGDHLKRTVHLTALEDGIYRRLLDAYYIAETPLPCEIKGCYKLARAISKAEREAVGAILREFFTLEADGYHHSRCDVEIARFRDKQTKAKASANARWNKPEPTSEGNADAMRTDMRTHCEGSAPRARPQSPVTSNQVNLPTTSDGKPSAKTSKDIIFNEGLSLLTLAGNTEDQARKFLGGLCKGHGDDMVAEKIREAQKVKPVEPRSWLTATLQPKSSGKRLPTVHSEEWPT